MHTDQRRPVIERCGNLSHIWNVVRKSKENNQKVEKINQVIYQTPTPRPKHDKIWTWWALDIMLNNMLENVWWWKCFKIESWSWTICYLMNCSKKGKHACAKGGKKLHVALKCCYKRKMLLSTCAKARERKILLNQIWGRLQEGALQKEHWSTINLTLMMEATRA